VGTYICAHKVIYRPKYIYNLYGDIYILNKCAINELPKLVMPRNVIAQGEGVRPLPTYFEGWRDILCPHTFEVEEKGPREM